MLLIWKYVLLPTDWTHYTDCFLKVLKSLVEQKVDWYLDELVSEMETYWEECLHTNFMAIVKYLWNNEEEGDWFIVTYQVSDEQRISFINLQQNEMKCYEAFLWRRLGNILQSS